VSVFDRLVLASASPRRSALLREAGYRFRVEAAEVDESPPKDLSPADAATAVALRKALAAAGRVPGAVVIAADTIVVAPGGVILGKPADAEDARRMLSRLSGSTHSVITGVAVIDTATGARETRAVETEIVFGRMSERDIDRYVESGEAMGKAGAYAIQERADRFVREVRGSFTNVVGLPMEALGEMLESLERADAEAGRRKGG